ncbi:MAG: YdeI/OmpD-associated family protein [Nitrospirota bacterium]
MPAFIRMALLENGVMETYRLRPAYQQNDYLGWITRAKLEPTRQRRLAQMLDERARGDRYMKMAWRPKRS